MAIKIEVVVWWWYDKDDICF